ncbi:MAG: glycoside hydrolase family 65 protein [Gemmatimonadetes bacterium]|uniref:Glycoside hydrolase family 65 protein n=1 Tax=Candidatus Kutchimonas denitrificans TaxID=3056748 RepID=A0AAE4ZCC8_9BACT|nr:glycoside hydrolase family 65 protein [Gemmatimonadota bacterium]NIR76611.1 glycoside hydrolase family 65 protein [Candidatus Kutchimonas denitrificans]NIS03380.1 glycoside hydrolase family 65 protein [Gemmatimonadota bacterium]NIT69241.1 glycoside hydrolase family 65 protein [Gemmatimonadota bacterium]NIU54713.1 glycoside hydrolase family 65 protein [Gemmatimonadota bacterium]
MDGWKLVYEGWEPEKEGLREALCTLGNGYFATRGASPFFRAGGPHYPGTYLAGGYNRLKTEIAGREIENEDLVNWPNWTLLTFRIDDGDWFSFEGVEILEYRQELDLREGLLYWHARFRDESGRETTLRSRRLVHMADMHIAAIELTIIPENWSGRLEIRSALDGQVRNEGVERYRQLNSQHLEHVKQGQLDDERIFLLVKTIQSRLEMAQAARTRVFRGGGRAELDRSTREESSYVEQLIRCDGRQGEPLRVEKVVTVYTSRDWAISAPDHDAGQTLGRLGTFDELSRTHKLAWSRLWHRCDIEFADGENAQLALRVHIFHLLQTVSPNTTELDVGVPARGLHGEAYRGHIFWDELYIFPFLELRLPEVARALLMYRYRRLDEARRIAAAEGFRGALYPWQSGSDGREETQVLHLNPRSGNWVRDNTHLQRHVNSAIAFNVWRHYQASGRRDFICKYGARIILEIARFWASAATFNSERGRYEIKGVVGPDEYHTAYPDAEQPGLNNNAYTNIMASWVLQTAARVIKLLDADCAVEIFEDLQITDEELASWDEISRKLYVPFIEDGIIAQFEGYEELDEFDWQGYQAKYGDIHRLDRILEAEGDTPNRYKVSKQADVLMLFYLFSAERLEQLFEHLGYRFDPEMIPRNIDYYLNRTSHGSTLSALINSWVQTRSDRSRSWRWLQAALRSDLEDVQGGTTQEGIHLGAMAGTVDLVQRCYSGIALREGVMWLNPVLPSELKSIRSRILYRGHWFSIHITHDTLAVAFEGIWSPYARIAVHDRIYTFKRGERKEFALSAETDDAELAADARASDRSTSAQSE